MYDMKKKEENSISKKLLETMMEKRVSEFCMELMNALQTLEVEL